MLLNCHSIAAGSMHSTAATKATAQLVLPVMAHAARTKASFCSKRKVAAQALPAWQSPGSAAARLHTSSSSSRPIRHIAAAAAAATDTLASQDSVQEPSVDFLGVVNGMQTARGIVHTAVDADHVYQQLTDFDSCPRVFRSVARSQTLQTEDGGKQVVQAGKWQFLFFRGTFDVRLNVKEHPQDRTVVFTLAESSFMQNFEGRWQIHALPDGGTCAEYVLAVQPSIPIPAAAAPYTSGIFKKQVADLLEDLQKELNRQIASGAAPTAK